eukprot:12321803-Heterocapsa_arctica.AAC.1
MATDRADGPRGGRGRAHAQHDHLQRRHQRLRARGGVGGGASLPPGDAGARHQAGRRHLQSGPFGVQARPA